MCTGFISTIDAIDSPSGLLVAVRRHGEAEEAAAVARVDRGPVHV